MKQKHLQGKNAHIDALNDAVSDLDQQLDKTIESEQHDIIDHLDDYFDSVETRLASLRTFYGLLRDELKQKKKGT